MTLTLYTIIDRSCPEPGVGSLLRLAEQTPLCPALLCLLLTLVERNELMKSKHFLESAPQKADSGCNVKKGNNFKSIGKVRT